MNLISIEKVIGWWTDIPGEPDVPPVIQPDMAEDEIWKRALTTLILRNGTTRETCQWYGLTQTLKHGPAGILFYKALLDGWRCTIACWTIRLGRRLSGGLDKDLPKIMERFGPFLAAGVYCLVASDPVTLIDLADYTGWRRPSYIASGVVHKLRVMHSDFEWTSGALCVPPA